MQLRIGQKVQVMLPKDQTGVNTVKQFQGKISKIKSICIYKNGNTRYYSYTLAGCKSDWGIDYEFAEDWLVPLDDEEVTE